jgi:hypothetical protein
MIARMRRLEARLALRESPIAIEQWCDPNGQPCDPPEEVRGRVEATATGWWPVAAWAPESGWVVQLSAVEPIARGLVTKSSLRMD